MVEHLPRNMSGSQEEDCEDLTELLSHLDPSSFPHSEFQRLHISGRTVLSNHSINHRMQSPPINGCCEPHSAGACSTSSGGSTSATTSETKKMGKFKFLTIPSASEQASDVLSASDRTPDSYRQTSPVENSPQRRPSGFPTSPSLPTGPRILRFSPEGSPFGIPGPLSLANALEAPKLTDEDLIDKHVKRLLKVTEKSNPISTVVDVVEEEEEEDSDFESRINKMIAEEDRNRKKGRKKTNSRSSPVGKRYRRTGKRTKKPPGKEETENAPVVPVVVAVVSDDVAVDVMKPVNGPPVMVMDEHILDMETLEQMETESRTPASTPKSPRSVKDMPLSNGPLTRLRRSDSENEKTPTQLSDLEGKDSEEPLDFHTLKKPKSHWLEQVYSGPPVTVKNEGEKENVTNEKIRAQQAAVSVTPVTVNYARPGEEPPGYDKISECVRLSKRRHREDRDVRKMRCECQYTEEEFRMGIRGCLEGCWNRELYIECVKCAARDNCGNRRFQRKEYSPLDVFKTEFKGWGIRAMTSLPAGQFICEYVGEVLDGKQFRKRQKEYDKENLEHHYSMALNNDEIIDATRKGNCTRFTNHSCDPNCETQKWTVNGQLRIGFFTLRPVMAGEEITFDYQFERYGKTAQRCFCGSAKCRQYIVPATVAEERTRTRDTREGLTDRKMISEIDRFTQIGAIRNYEHALRLARLLIRVEEDRDRLVLLRILQNSEPDRLRDFLRCQGLTILADTMYCCRNSSTDVRIEILRTLSILPPFRNKNALTDSNVLGTLEKWAIFTEAKEKSINGPLTRSASENTLAVVDSSQPTSTELENALPVDDALTEKALLEMEEPLALVKLNGVVTRKEGTGVDENEEESAVVDPGASATVRPEEEALVRKMATDLLEGWRDLAVEFRIPKKIMVSESAAVFLPSPAPVAPNKLPIFRPPTKFSSDKPTNSFSLPTIAIPNLMQRYDRTQRRSPSPPHQDSSQRQKRTKFDHPNDDYRENNQERRYDFDRNEEYRDRRSFEEDRRAPPYDDDRRPHYEERRRRRPQRSEDNRNGPFTENDQRNRDENRCDDMRNRFPPENERHNGGIREGFEPRQMGFQDGPPRNFQENGFLPPLHPHPQFSGPPLPPHFAVPLPQFQGGLPPLHSLQFAGPPPLQHPLAFPPGLPPPPFPRLPLPPQMSGPPPLQPSPFPGVPPFPPPHPHFRPPPLPQNFVCGPPPPLGVLHHQPPVSMPAAAPAPIIADPFYEAALNAAMDVLKRNMVQAASEVSTRLLNNRISSTQKVSVLLPDGSLHEARTFTPTAEQTNIIRASLPEVGSAEWMEKADLISSLTGSAIEPIEAPVTKHITGWTCNYDLSKVASASLPPGWEPAYDRTGRLYFYNTSKNVSRWDFPVDGRDYASDTQSLSSTLSVPTDLEDCSLVPEGSVNLQVLLPESLDEKDPNQTRTLRKLVRPPIPRPSTEEQGRLLRLRNRALLKKRKVQFQNDVCQYIRQVLDVYRTPQCNQGRIEDKEDFKFLARKFTHSAVELEVERHKNNPEALKFSSRHKPKIKDYIRKYMSRFGKVYKRESRPENGLMRNEEEDEEEEDDEDIEETPGKLGTSPLDNGGDGSAVNEESFESVEETPEERSPGGLVVSEDNKPPDDRHDGGNDCAEGEDGEKEVVVELNVLNLDFGENSVHLGKEYG